MKSSAFGFLLKATQISAYSCALLAAVLQLDVFQQQMQFVNLQIFLGTLVRVSKEKPKIINFLHLYCFLLLLLVFFLCVSCAVMLLLFAFTLSN
jgi:hypothetical protein